MLSWTKKIAFLFLLLFSAFSVTAQVEEWMPDATLRQAVLTKLDLPAGVPLTKDKMLSLQQSYIRLIIMTQTCQSLTSPV